MVEQVRVNPTEVRGYGNICEGHTLEDFIVSNSGLAKEKEEVHGALTEVYKLVYSLYGLIFSFDKGNKQLYLHSDNDAVVGFSFSEKSLVFNTVSHISFAFADKDLVVDDEYYLFIDDGTTASHNDSWTVTNGTMTRMDSYTRLVESAQTLMCLMNSAYITSTSTVEFDFKAVDGVKNLGLVYIRNSGGGNSLANLTLNNIGGDIGEWIHLKIVFNNTNTITIYSSKLENPITKTLSSTDSNYRLLLYCGGTNTELHFKNVKVYD